MAGEEKSSGNSVSSYHTHFQHTLYNMHTVSMKIKAKYALHGQQFKNYMSSLPFMYTNIALTISVDILTTAVLQLKQQQNKRCTCTNTVIWEIFVSK